MLDNAPLTKSLPACERPACPAPTLYIQPLVNSVGLIATCTGRAPGGVSPTFTCISASYRRSCLRDTAHTVIPFHYLPALPAGAGKSYRRILWWATLGDEMRAEGCARNRYGAPGTRRYRTWRQDACSPATL